MQNWKRTFEMSLRILFLPFSVRFRLILFQVAAAKKFEFHLNSRDLNNNNTTSQYWCGAKL